MTEVTYLKCRRCGKETDERYSPFRDKIVEHLYYNKETGECVGRSYGII